MRGFFLSKKLSACRIENAVGKRLVLALLQAMFLTTHHLWVSKRCILGCEMLRLNNAAFRLQNHLPFNKECQLKIPASCC